MSYKDKNVSVGISEIVSSNGYDGKRQRWRRDYSVRDTCDVWEWIYGWYQKKQESCYEWRLEIPLNVSVRLGIDHPPIFTQIEHYCMLHHTNIHTLHVALNDVKTSFVWIAWLTDQWMMILLWLGIVLTQMKRGMQISKLKPCEIFRW
jgi:hypothetical protein